MRSNKAHKKHPKKSQSEFDGCASHFLVEQSFPFHAGQVDHARGQERHEMTLKNRGRSCPSFERESRSAAFLDRLLDHRTRRLEMPTDGRPSGGLRGRAERRKEKPGRAAWPVGDSW